MGKIVETFGKIIQDECDKNSAAARKLEDGAWQTGVKGGAAGVGGDYEFHDCAPGSCGTGGYGQSVYAL